MAASHYAHRGTILFSCGDDKKVFESIKLEGLHPTTDY